MLQVRHIQVLLERSRKRSGSQISITFLFPLFQLPSCFISCLAESKRAPPHLHCLLLKVKKLYLFRTVLTEALFELELYK